MLTLVWECLIKNGLISEFYVNLDVTDTINHLLILIKRKIYLTMKSKINKNRSNYDNSYYYLIN